MAPLDEVRILHQVVSQSVEMSFLMGHVTAKLHEEFLSQIVGWKEGRISPEMHHLHCMVSDLLC